MLRYHLLNLGLGLLMSAIAAVGGLSIGGCVDPTVAYFQPGEIRAEVQNGVIVIVGDAVITCEVPNARN